jgi:hypothetical protein
LIPLINAYNKDLQKGSVRYLGWNKAVEVCYNSAVSSMSTHRATLSSQIPRSEPKMANGTVERSPRVKARIAGVLYVIIIALALFAPFPVAPSWLLRGDVSATLTKILVSKSLYSLGGVAELIVYACDLGVALIFYELLKPVSKSLALLALFFRLTFVAIASTNVLNHFAPLLLMSGAEYLASLNPDQLRTLAVTFIRLHTIGFDIALVFFGFHCVMVGYLFSDLSSSRVSWAHCWRLRVCAL